MKILIVKTSSLGDIVQAFPVLELLKGAFPYSFIDWVVEARCSAIVKANPLVNKVIEIDSKPLTFSNLKAAFRSVSTCRYDVVIDLQGNIKSGFLTFFSRSAKKVGFARESVAEWPNILATNIRYNVLGSEDMSADYISIVRQHFNLEQEGVFKTVLSCDEEQISLLSNNYPDLSRTILICTGSNWPNKRLLPEQWSLLMDGLLKGTNFKYLFVQSNAEELSLAVDMSKKDRGRIGVLERLSLPLLQNTMLYSSGVIAMDSLPLHLAGLAKVPIFGIFGPSMSGKYMPRGHGNSCYQAGCPYGKVFDKRCKELRSCATGDCLKKVAISALLDKMLLWANLREG